MSSSDPSRSTAEAAPTAYGADTASEEGYCLNPHYVNPETHPELGVSQSPISSDYGAPLASPPYYL